MANNLYTTKTAALKATKADINKLETKKLKVNGKDVVLGAKHANDTRETVTENDIWGQYIETLEDGTAIVHDDYVKGTTLFYDSIANKITKVIDEKAYEGDTFLKNIQTSRVKDGTYMFYATNLSEFDSDISSLENAMYMFLGTQIKFFELKSHVLTNANYMFRESTKLETLKLNYNYSASNITNIDNICYGCNNLTTVYMNLPLCTSAKGAFGGCNNMSNLHFESLDSLEDGEGMFSNSSISNLYCSLENLKNGAVMFAGSKVISFNKCL